ncbi:hypothetical protein [Staphylococcus simulans]|nr:hypothetical protein [Staphylococcus simulans]
MVAGGGGYVADALLIGIFAGETIHEGVEVKDLIRTTQTKVVVYSWKYQ